MRQMADEVMERAVTHLRDDEGCHTIILYGSRARGDAGPDSDYDLVAFRDRDGQPVRETGLRHGGLMDIVIYPTVRLNSPDPDMLHVRDGVVLLERDGLGAAFLNGLKRVFEAGPSALSADEIEARRNWHWKMLDRAARGDAEGDFRRVWLLTMLLENYFHIRRQWYLGAKQALALLRSSRPELYALFERALAPGASHADIEALVHEVNGPHS